MLHGETIHSPLPQDIPWWSPDFAVFFGVLYLVLFVIGTGVGYVILRSIWDTCRGSCGCHGEEHPAFFRKVVYLPLSVFRPGVFCRPPWRVFRKEGVMTNARSLSERRRL